MSYTINYIKIFKEIVISNLKTSLVVTEWERRDHSGYTDYIRWDSRWKGHKDIKEKTDGG